MIESRRASRQTSKPESSIVSSARKVKMSGHCVGPNKTTGAGGPEGGAPRGRAAAQPKRPASPTRPARARAGGGAPALASSHFPRVHQIGIVYFVPLVIAHFVVLAELLEEIVQEPVRQAPGSIILPAVGRP